MIRSIVLEEHTLGVVYPMGNLFQLQILHTSPLRGSPIQGDPLSSMGTMVFCPYTSKYRTATEQDFNDFRVSFHPDYLTEIDVPQRNLL